MATGVVFCSVAKAWDFCRRLDAAKNILQEPHRGRLPFDEVHSADLGHGVAVSETARLVSRIVAVLPIYDRSPEASAGELLWALSVVPLTLPRGWRCAYIIRDLIRTAVFRLGRITCLIY